MPGTTKTKRVLNVIPSKNTEKDWSIANAKASGMLGAPAAPPASKDLRESWWKIGDQKSTGSCVGWGTAEGVLRWHFVKAGKISKSTNLSPRYVWMAAKETDEFTSRPTSFIESDGTSLKSALDIARKFGVVKDSVLPFGSGNLFAGEADNFYATASMLKISAYINMFLNLAQWKTWLANNGPILAALNVDKTWDNAASTGGKLDTYLPDTARGGHCIAIVGYKSDGRFIIRNSWGKTWGDNGFAYATPDYISAGFFNESYGVNL